MSLNKNFKTFTITSLVLSSLLLSACSDSETVNDEKTTPTPTINVYPEPSDPSTPSADDEVVASGFIAGNGMSGWDGLKIYVTGNDDRIVISSQFDNLGKGASGAAIECMNLVLGCEATKGLSI